MAKEEELDNEDMDSDFDETDHAQINNDHQMVTIILKTLLTDILNNFSINSQ